MNSTLLSNFEHRAARRYPNSKEMQANYVNALIDCKLNPAYSAETSFGNFPCNCRPLMEDDVKEWTVVKRRIRVKKVKTQSQLEEESELKNWDDVEHYGRATYAYTQPSYEHNGALFDIGSRF